MVGLYQFQALPAPSGLCNPDFRFFQQVAEHLAVDCIVVHHQDFCIRRKEFRPICVIFRKLAGPGFKIPNGGTVHNFLLQLEIKFGSLAILAFYQQLAPHQGKELDGNAHPKAGAFDIPVPLLLNPFKFRRQLGQVLLLNPHACIFHFKPQHRRPIGFQAPYPHPNRPLRGIFHCIGKDIGKHLADPHIVPVQPGGYALVCFHHKLDAFSLCPLGSHVGQVVD